MVHHHAGLVERWAVRLETDSVRAAAWFRESEPTLRPLFRHEHYADDPLLARVLDDLCTIADGLEAWYVRERWSSGLLEVNHELYQLVGRAGRADLAALAAIRSATAHRIAGRHGRAVAELDVARSQVGAVHDDRVRSELDAREQVERALLAMAGTEPDPDGLHEAVHQLGRLRGGRRDVAGHPALLINLGALCLRRGRAAEALAHLRQAADLAAELDDTGCVAHATELRGVALSQQDDQLVEAARQWQLARAMFAGIGEDHGAARCLQHLGSAVLFDPRVAGHVRDGRPVALVPRDAAAVAVDLLVRAKSLRSGQPDTALLDHYLAEARLRLS